MGFLAKLLIGLVVLVESVAGVVQIGFWTGAGQRMFEGVIAPELFADAWKLAANQGIYNLLFAAGLIWSFFITDALWATRVARCFLAMVAVAGVFAAGVTDFQKALYVQTLPATLAMIAQVLAARRHA